MVGRWGMSPAIGLVSVLPARRRSGPFPAWTATVARGVHARSSTPRCGASSRSATAGRSRGCARTATASIRSPRRCSSTRRSTSARPTPRPASTARCRLLAAARRRSQRPDDSQGQKAESRKPGSRDRLSAVCFLLSRRAASQLPGSPAFAGQPALERIRPERGAPPLPCRADCGAEELWSWIDTTSSARLHGRPARLRAAGGGPPPARACRCDRRAAGAAEGHAGRGGGRRAEQVRQIVEVAEESAAQIEEPPPRRPRA